MNLESHQVMDVYDYVLQARPEILKASNRNRYALCKSHRESKHNQQPNQ